MSSSWFIAYPVPAGAWWSGLPPAPPGLRIVSSVDLHLTLAFLGRIDESRAREAFASLPSAAIGSWDITLGAVAPMGNPRRPSALCAVAQGYSSSGRSIDEELGALRDPLLAAAGLAPETRPPRPHVTLARIRRRAGGRERAQALEWAAGIDLGSPSLSLDALALYTGSPSGSGHAYERVERRAADPPKSWNV